MSLAMVAALSINVCENMEGSIPRSAIPPTPSAMPIHTPLLLRVDTVKKESSPLSTFPTWALCFHQGVLSASFSAEAEAV